MYNTIMNRNLKTATMLDRGVSHVKEHKLIAHNRPDRIYSKRFMARTFFMLLGWIYHSKEHKRSRVFPSPLQPISFELSDFSFLLSGQALGKSEAYNLSERLSVHFVSRHIFHCIYIEFSFKFYFLWHLLLVLISVLGWKAHFWLSFYQNIEI